MPGTQNIITEAETSETISNNGEEYEETGAFHDFSSSTRKRKNRKDDDDGIFVFLIKIINKYHFSSN